jgi:hypothetical protein
MRRLFAVSTLTALLALSVALFATLTQGFSAANTGRSTFLSRGCSNGESTVTAVPTKAFNPLAATAAELLANDYPPRPPARDRQDYTTWKKFVLSHSGTVATCTRVGTSVEPEQHAQTVYPMENTHWSGYQTNFLGYNDVEAEWQVPAMHDSGRKSYYSVSWVGLGDGGGHSDELIQAGSASEWVAGSAHYYLWWELFPGITEQHIYGSNQGMRPGDLIYVNVHFASHEASFHLEDETTGYNFFQTAPLGSSWRTSGDAEWIYERPTIGGSLPYLANAPVTFLDAEAEDSSGWRPLNGLTVFDYAMWNCNFTERLAYADAISDSAGFREQYQNPGDDKSCDY